MPDPDTRGTIRNADDAPEAPKLETESIGAELNAAIVHAADAAIAVGAQHLHDLVDAVDALAEAELKKLGEKGKRLLEARAHIHI